MDTLKAGKELAAAFLETRRYAAYLGATTEFTKFEGVAFNPTANDVYVAMARIEKSMLSVPTDPADDIKLSKNMAGAVYKLHVTGSISDTSGSVINSNYVATTMSSIAELEGLPLASADTAGNTANLNKVANPDNLKYSYPLNTLFIGEDSDMHVQNTLWAFNPTTKQLVRLATTPTGAESTGLQAVNDYNGFSYLMSNFQHAGDGIDFSKPDLVGVKALIDQKWNTGKKASVGYFLGCLWHARQNLQRYYYKDMAEQAISFFALSMPLKCSLHRLDLFNTKRCVYFIRIR